MSDIGKRQVDEERKDMPGPNEPIAELEVGGYGELCDRPNPNGLVILTVPAFEEILPSLEQQAGHRFNAEEIEPARRQAPSIVVTHEIAEQMYEARSKRA